MGVVAGSGEKLAAVVPDDEYPPTLDRDHMRPSLTWYRAHAQFKLVCNNSRSVPLRTHWQSSLENSGQVIRTSGKLSKIWDEDMRESLLRRKKEIANVHLVSPATDWWGGYKRADGSLHFQPLAVWAYVNVEHRQVGPNNA